MQHVVSSAQVVRSESGRRPRTRFPWLRLWAGIIVASTVWFVSGVVAMPTAHAAALSTPVLVGPINRTETTISVRIYRVAESSMVCQPDIGYEFRGGVYSDWHDVGGFPNAPCNDPDPGYKFSHLTPGTTYTLSVRAYRIVDGVKVDFSAAASLSLTTLGGTTTPPPTTPPPTTPPPTGGSPLAAPTLASAPTGFTETSISVRIFRSPDSGGVCRNDIGYQVRGGTFADWADAGAFVSACTRNDVGYKFSGLAPSTTYTLSVRAYRLVDGVKTDFSSAASMTASTAAGTSATPPPTTPPPTTPPPTTPPPTTPPPPTTGGPLSAPLFASTPTSVTWNSISVRIFRSTESGGVCQADIGYEVRGGSFADWSDVGGFSSACASNAVGYRFANLFPATTYPLSVRAYRTVDGVKTEFSAASSITAATSSDAPPLAPPSFAPSPSSRTTTSISVRIYRSSESGGVCHPGIGYEVRGGAFADWTDVGGLTASCSSNVVGYKFSGLTPGTEYTFSVRGYRIIDGVKSGTSTVASITASTLAATTTPPPTTTPPTTTTPPPTTTPPTGGSTLAAPTMAATPTSRTATSISVRIFRTPDSAGVCQADIGYEVRGGASLDWQDAGGFTAACSSNAVGYKFSGLAPTTTYVLSVRAYRIVDGVKSLVSGSASITASTTA